MVAVCSLEREGDGVEALEDHFAVAGLDGEGQGLVADALDFAGAEVHRQAEFPAFGLGAERVHLFFRQDYRHEAVLRAVGLEDFAEAGRDDCAYAPVGQRPDGVFARRATAEVVA